MSKERIKPTKEVIINKLPPILYKNTISNNIKINVLTRNEEQLLFCIENNNINDIYVVDYNLYQKYKDNSNNKKIYYQTTRLKPKLLPLNNENILATELSSIVHYSKNNSVISDYYLNVVNNDTINYFKTLNVKRITLSVELGKEQLKKLNHTNTELIIYGRPVVMLTKYCPLKELLNKNNIYNNQ